MSKILSLSYCNCMHLSELYSKCICYLAQKTVAGVDHWAILIFFCSRRRGSELNLPWVPHSLTAVLWNLWKLLWGLCRKFSGVGSPWANPGLAGGIAYLCCIFPFILRCFVLEWNDPEVSQAAVRMRASQSL